MILPTIKRNKIPIFDLKLILKSRFLVTKLRICPKKFCEYPPRFPSLFRVHRFFKNWTANYETANKKTNVRPKLKAWFIKKGIFWTATADKKDANNE